MRGPSEDRGAISPQTVAAAGLLVAVAGLILAGVAGAPYLSSDGVERLDRGLRRGALRRAGRGAVRSRGTTALEVSRPRCALGPRRAGLGRDRPPGAGGRGARRSRRKTSRATRWPALPGCWRWSRAGSWWSRRSPCSSRARFCGMRAVVIAGASGGIGRACALRLARNGFRVFAGYRKEADAASLADEAAGQLEMLPIDVTDADQIASASSAVTDAVGADGLWGLVNNAGVAVPGPVESLPIDDLRRQLEVNLVGQVAVTQALLPSLRRARGRVLNMTSVGGRVGYTVHGRLPCLEVRARGDVRRPRGASLPASGWMSARSSPGASPLRSGIEVASMPTA